MCRKNRKCVSRKSQLNNNIYDFESQIYACVEFFKSSNFLYLLQTIYVSFIYDGFVSSQKVGGLDVYGGNPAGFYFCGVPLVQVRLPVWRRVGAD
jgi:hypothetical protein